MKSEARLMGLSAKEASSILLRVGVNELPTAKPLRWYSILFRVVQEPMLILLLACSGIYIFMGNTQESILLLFSVLLVLAITFFQEKKAERSLQALRDLSSPRALVIREGLEQRIPGREVVPNDVIIIKEGDRIPADALLITARNLQVDESLLTGEAFPIHKNAGAKVFSGTLAVGGSAYAKVNYTGTHTQIGKIGSHLRDRVSERSQLQEEISNLVRKFAVLGFGVSILVAIAYGLTLTSWTGGILAGLAAAISLLPEEFPVVLTVFLVVGSWRIAQKHVLTRNVSAIETLGTVSHLCVDKTGTLTMNQMKVKILSMHTPEDGLAPSPSHLIDIADLASHIDPFDPMEKAIRISASEHHVAKRSPAWKFVQEYPMSSALFAMSCAWRRPEHSNFFITSKGSPEAMIALSNLPKPEAEQILRRVHELAQQGLRVLGVAEAQWPLPHLPEDPHEFEFKFLGLIGFEDPVRPGVSEALIECYQAGIRVIMMTGDYPETAMSVARQIGLKSPNEVITGDELREITDLELLSRLKTVNVFARVVSDQKMRIINALKKQGAIVAMTGDGVNDAPALKWADIGIAMGNRGTDVAREASDLVLVNDDFSSIVVAIRLGRRIYANIRKAISFIFAAHVPIAGLTTLPVLLGGPLVLLPAHLVFLELIIDPAYALIFESETEEAGIMNQNPRNSKARMFSFRQIIAILLQGSIVFLFVFLLYWFGLRSNRDQDIVRAMTFVALVIANLGLILVYRSNQGGLLQIFQIQNRTFFWVALGEFLLLASLLMFPLTRSLFKFGILNFAEIVVSVTIGLGAMTLIGFVKQKKVQAN